MSHVFQNVADTSTQTRQRFIQRTYAHLLGAIVGFTAIEILLFKSGLAERMAVAMLGTSWLLVLGGFVVVGWLATYTAHRAASLGSQYASLAAYVIAEAVIFLPLLFVAEFKAPGVIRSAAVTTLLGFGGLTAIAFLSGRDFSFLRAILTWAGLCALLLIVVSLLFGLHLGTWFSVAMVALSGGSILYKTSNIMHRYPEDRHVGAALELFASVALMFWYTIRLLSRR